MKEIENINKLIVDYSEYLNDIVWESCDFYDFSLYLMYSISNVLCDYGQVSEETFLMHNLKEKFPDLTKEDLDNYSENIDELHVGEKDGTDYFLFKDPRHAFKLIESMRFRNLKKQYENDTDILNLKEILGDLYKIVNVEGIEFSQVEKIEVIKKALQSKHPKGLVFDLTPKKEEKN
jgi:hypothetical protein